MGERVSRIIITPVIASAVNTGTTEPEEPVIMEPAVIKLTLRA